MASSLFRFFFFVTLLCFVSCRPPNPPWRAQRPVLTGNTLHHAWDLDLKPWTRVRDLIIETIWGPPPKGPSAPSKQLSTTFPPPSKYGARYGREVVLRFRVSSAEEIEALLKASDTLFIDVWSATEEWVDLRIAKDVVPSFLDLLPRPLRQSLRQSYSPLMHDLARAVYDTYPSRDPQHTALLGGTSGSLLGEKSVKADREAFFQEYRPLSIIYPWMRLMVSLFPSYSDIIDVGFSHEGRAIKGLRLGNRFAHDDPGPRQTILISGGSHAREWISTSTVNYIAYSLMTRYGKFGGVTKLLDHFDVILVPTFNPDGYVFTWDHDRLWRKNRQSTALPFCHGVDLDRAFGFAWDGAASWDNPCSESYAGTEPFSAPEARALAEWARNETESGLTNFIAYLDLHSYSQQVLYPYSYSCHVYPPTLEDLEEVAMDIAKGFRLARGHHYGVSSACEGSSSINSVRRASHGVPLQPKLQAGGGSALDWFYHDLRVKYAYQIKLRDTGSYGFLLPKEKIVPTGQEGFNAVMALGKYLLGNHGIEKWDKIDWDAEMIYPLPASHRVNSSPYHVLPPIDENMPETYVEHGEEYEELYVPHDQDDEDDEDEENERQTVEFTRNLRPQKARRRR